ncbi:hypothetical protein L9F63_005593 [Diploptera punctata]|uniref:Uncharacterized protein n=1 Tax=Diploptera punctata TaxID=6984 RepID=A0AAD8E655_DIPPU|nr:hypothetical protein L9F63_005593 [Diploptera punctata]
MFTEDDYLPSCVTDRPNGELLESEKNYCNSEPQDHGNDRATPEVVPQTNDTNVASTSSIPTVQQKVVSPYEFCRLPKAQPRKTNRANKRQKYGCYRYAGERTTRRISSEGKNKVFSPG